MEVQSINGIEASNIYQGRVYGDGIYSEKYVWYLKDENRSITWNLSFNKNKENTS